MKSSGSIGLLPFPALTFRVNLRNSLGRSANHNDSIDKMRMSGRMDCAAQVPRWIFVAIGMLLAFGYAPITCAVFELSHSSTDRTEEPITPVPEPPAVDPMKAALGERLFGDVRLSRDNTRKCSSCHDLATNGANKNVQDTTADGSRLPLNTPTIFNTVAARSAGAGKPDRQFPQRQGHD